jgi:CRISPR-associated endonuclease/helicase Cas3
MDTDILLAKSSQKKQPYRLDEDFRHEFASLLDAQNESEFQNLSDDMKEVVLHLIAAHHGRGRPHFPMEEAFDPEPNGKDISTIAAQVPQRFARLQRKYGRWGLAYLESLLRAADYAASASPSATVEVDQ